MTNRRDLHDISAVEEMVTILVLMADEHTAKEKLRAAAKPAAFVGRYGRGQSAKPQPGGTTLNVGGRQVRLGETREQGRWDTVQIAQAPIDLIESTICIACGDGYDPEDLVHPEGVEALALFMYCIATNTWERTIPPLPVVTGRVLNCTGSRQAWRWRRVLTKATALIARRENQ